MPPTRFLRRFLRRRPPSAGRYPRAFGAAVVVGLSALTAASTQAQDVYFSQPYATRLHLNPAFTGLFDDASIALAYRNQYPTLIGSLQTSQLAADYRLRDQRSAVGLLVNADRGGGLNLTRLEAGFTYAYHARLSQDLYVSGGAHAAYGSQRISYGNLLFGDQIDDNGQPTGTSAEPLVYDPVRYLTLGLGGLFYTPNTWGGLAIHHVNQPQVGVASDAVLPFRLAVHGGYKHYFVKTTVKREYREVSLAPTGSYTYQGGSQRLELGVYGTNSPLTAGLLWRGALPGPGNAQQTLVALLGLTWSGFRFGYSYDVSLSRFSRETGGAHEITLALTKFDLIEAAKRRLRRKNYTAPPCPTF
ncbi:type IX secretion system membrane protein PorP/SprF [Hymenobacter busanensis]|uniref:Type IX secretion system membrane protein PorP/SprF n=1 Tax=Hymenobacter busanensis TaxID=2607656 RepID=A0A7L4ZZT4_9BACT|nr:PorP/SprF family type IX secretion system membrane protein [Hymenobacter busanensis]KAA9332970.1 type IX secretion system membrane protein PorP/SprF [Hymenobacter busanensis]QHJ08356.1 type IX secretion system membrane protein PorP/SprF [Hymenobacter busanensis]